MQSDLCENWKHKGCESRFDLHTLYEQLLFSR
jgi:hypothetical protein